MLRPIAGFTAGPARKTYAFVMKKVSGTFLVVTSVNTDSRGSSGDVRGLGDHRVLQFSVLLACADRMGYGDERYHIPYIISHQCVGFARSKCHHGGVRSDAICGTHSSFVLVV